MSIAEEFQAALNASGQTLERQMSRHGLTLARVTNVTDPDKLNRVKCLPIENENLEETDWIYVMAPMGGKGCGQFFFPNVNDLVVLAYLGGDPQRPMVIGSTWNTEVRPPYVIDQGKVLNFSIRTPNGTELLFYDEKGKERVTVTMPSGTVFTMDDGQESVSVRDKGGDNALSMDLKGGDIRLKAGKKLTLSAGDTAITLEASGTITGKAKSKIALEAANIEEKANAKVAIQAAQAQVKANATLDLEASGPATLKGAIVNIN